MRIVPVLDLLEGCVVRGVAGERQRYRPIESPLVDVPTPLNLARAFRDRFGLSTLYVADLDAILHDRPNLECYRALIEEDFELMIDAGLRDLSGAERVLATGAQFVIAGLETLSGPDLLGDFVRRIGAERVIFSLDLKQGVPLCDPSSWGHPEPIAIASAAMAQGIERMIVLDLAQVGVGGGISTRALCSEILSRHASAKIITGGGLRTAADLDLLTETGIDGVLVASALHDGRLTRADIEGFHSGSALRSKIRG